MVGTWYVFEPTAVVIEVVVHHGGVGLAPLGDVGEQTGATEEIDEGGIVGELVEDFHKFTCEHALLSYEREWCGEVQVLFHRC